jgi:uncharacterized membrane protein YvlD (DUF360 family)
MADSKVVTGSSERPPAEAGRLAKVGYAFWDPLSVVLSREVVQRRFLVGALITGASEAIAFLLVTWIIPGFHVDSFGTAIVATLIVAVLNALVRPALLQLTLGFTVLTLGLFSLVLNGFILVLAARLLPGFEIDNFWSATFGAIFLAAINFVLSSLLNVSDENSFYVSLVRRAARRRGNRGHAAGSPGLLVISIDGLSEPVLRFALRTGIMPTLARWVRDGSYRIMPWECELPSQTSASQAGLLYGRNVDIPAFRWYEKEHERRMVSNVPRDAAELQRRLSDGSGLLAGGGTAVGTLLSGDAARTPLVMGALQERAQVRPDDFYAYFVSPHKLTRTLVMSTREMFRELSQARRQRSRDVQPRVKRDLKFAFLRAAANVLMRDLTTATVVDNMFAGTPVIYANYLAYDEVAHHAGPERPEALEELSRIDDVIAFIDRARALAERDYRIVLLSDHGQSQGATFLQRYGVSLDDYIRQLIGAGHVVTESIGTTEEWASLSAMTTEGINAAGSVARAPLEGALKSKMDAGVATFGPDAHEGKERGSEDRLADAVVSASGNLAHVHLMRLPGRATEEAIESAFPGLIAGLVQHEGVGFALVRSQRDGAKVIGAHGVRYLGGDRVEGVDPLADFGPHAAASLRRIDGFDHVGDIVLNSMYRPTVEEVAAFEELVGSHGGLGGPQTKAFVAFPSEWNCPTFLLGAPAVHEVLRSWRDASRDPIAERDDATARAV